MNVRTEDYNGANYYNATLTFTYDANGTPLSMTVNYIEYVFEPYYDEYWGYEEWDYMPYYYSGTFYYVTNAQGDVIALLNQSGNKVMEYVYDAWGNVLYSSSHYMAELNPLLYRGYVYDSETGLYYLQSRYYDPEIGRFINADAFVATGQGFVGNNMFAYCLNNPVNMYDPNGGCGRFLGFLWKVDCGKTTCETSKNYQKTTSSFLEDFLTHMARQRENGNTFSVGVTGSVTSGGISNGKSYSLSVDTSHNYALQETTSLGASTGAGGSGGLVMTYTNATNVQDLSGLSNSKGFTLVGLAGLSVDLITFIPESNPNTTCWGISVAIAIGGELEAHAAQNYTTSKKSWNPFMALRDFLYGG